MEGENIEIVGNNGEGKKKMIKIMIGMIRKKKGEVSVMGEENEEGEFEERLRIG